jgi:Spy/CpxP family protein refolding chaperone
MFQFLTLGLFVAMIVILPLQAAYGGQEKAPCEKKMKAEGCEKMMMKAEGCMMLKLIPNLSDEQKGKLEKLHAGQQAMMAAAKVEMEKQALELKALMKDPVDVAKAEAKIDEIAKMKADMQKKHLTHFLAVRALLTAEQKAKLPEMGGCGMGGGMMGCCQMHMQGGMKEHGMKMEHGKCQKAEAEKK